MHLCAIYETNKDHAFGVTSLPTCLFWPITIPYSCISFFKTHPFILCRVIPYYGGGGWSSFQHDFGHFISFSSQQ